MPANPLSRLRSRAATDPSATTTDPTRPPPAVSAPSHDHSADLELDAPAVPFLHRRTAPRWRLESLLVRLIATAGVLAIGVALAAILGTQSVQAWVVGLSVSTVSVVLAALLWSSRTL